MARSTRRIDNGTRFFTDFEDQSANDDTLVIPDEEAIKGLTDEELATLTEQADEAFSAVYGDGTDLSEEDLETLRGLTSGIEVLNAESARREADAEARRTEAAELAAKVRPIKDEADGDDGDEEDGEDESDESDEDAEDGDDSEDSAETETVEVTAETEEQPESLAASARKEVKVNLGRVRSKQAATPKPRSSAPATMRDLVSPAANVEGFANGMDFLDMGKVVDEQLKRINVTQYTKAAERGKHLRQQFGVSVIERRFEDGLVIESSDREHVEKVLAKAVDEKRLPKGSLVASGGWCAPSETDYSLFNEGSTRDGIISLPEVGVRRGGIRFTRGADFSSIYADVPGFHYTEEQDIAGEYGVDDEGMGNDTAGDKPCFKVECPPFEDVRLDLDGLCITAGLLQSRGYPEVIADTIRKALIAHDHRIAGRVVNSLVAGSTAVNMPANQVGALAPVLTSIELQVEHYREVHRLGRATTIEAVFPYWVRGAIRSDLSRRLGIDLISVPDARIDGWFRDRGINPQFIYNWQGLATDAASGAASVTSWPDTVDFLLYAAGTWVKGGSDVITLDTIYDSVLLGSNDYTALFTEEGYLVAKRGFDSRVVTVPVCADGATAAGVAIDCDGSAEA